MKLTARQQQILDLIKQNIVDTGFPPTRAEIAKQLGFKSPNAAEEHLRALARKGAIEIVAGTSRGIRIIEDENAPKGLPVIGRVAAGSPILAQEHTEQHLNIPADMFFPQADYMLRVQGMSMKNIGIYEDDLVAIHKTERIRNGDVIVARVNDEVTLKRFQRNGSKVTLFPENEELKPIHVDLATERFTIEGLYVGVIRTQVH
jgi:repressor LexA